jgi:hypothetical protein
MLVRTASAVEEVTPWARWLYHRRNTYRGLKTWHWYHLLLAYYRRSVATDLLSKIVLSWKLLHKFKKWCKFSSCSTAKMHTNKSHKTRPACIQITHSVTCLFAPYSRALVRCVCIVSCDNTMMEHMYLYHTYAQCSSYKNWIFWTATFIQCTKEK